LVYTFKLYTILFKTGEFAGSGIKRKIGYYKVISYNNGFSKVVKIKE